MVKKLIWHSYNKEYFGSYLGNKGRDKVILKWLSNKRRKNAPLLLVYRAEKNLSGVFSICKDYKAMEEKEASSASSR